MGAAVVPAETVAPVEVAAVEVAVVVPVAKAAGTVVAR